MSLQFAYSQALISSSFPPITAAKSILSQCSETKWHAQTPESFKHLITATYLVAKNAGYVTVMQNQEDGQDEGDSPSMKGYQLHGDWNTERVRIIASCRCFLSFTRGVNHYTTGHYYCSSARGKTPFTNLMF